MHGTKKEIPQNYGLFNPALAETTNQMYYFFILKSNNNIYGYYLGTA